MKLFSNKLDRETLNYMGCDLEVTLYIVQYIMYTLVYLESETLGVWFGRFCLYVDVRGCAAGLGIVFIIFGIALGYRLCRFVIVLGNNVAKFGINEKVR